MTNKKNEKKDKVTESFKRASEINPTRTYFAKEQMAQLLEEHFKSQDIIKSKISTKQDYENKGGFCADELTTHQYNNEAILNGTKQRASNDNRPEWFNLETNQGNLKKNDPCVDVVTYDPKTNKVISSTQVKAYRTARETAQELAELVNNKPKYNNADKYKVPEDQYKEIIEYAKNKYEELKIKNPAKAEAYKQIYEKTEPINGFSKEDLNNLGKGDTSKLEKLDKQTQNQSTLQQMGKAAAEAAAVTSIVSGVINSITYIQMANEGKISQEDAFYKILGETAASAADSAVKASIQTGVNSMLTRSASKEAVAELLTEQGLKSMLKSNIVTVVVVSAVEALKDIVRLGCGEITEKEFYERQGKTLVSTSAGLFGGSIGTSAAMTTAQSIGLASGSLSYYSLTLAGGLTGALIAGLAMSLAIESGVEQPYKDLLRNTYSIKKTAETLINTSKSIYLGQQLMEQFVIKNSELNSDIQNSLKRLETKRKETDQALDELTKLL
ncbi:hypothetical protein [Succinivibrio dextrinosolvens]|uniref:hypothetical protein n=1 Tax=Succinivibrio dextrinosolvens TaxID=83771 RepID=UPI00247B01A5|nr:hypothetical protein [Succinivibrio dextrinosolvens]